jgi:hypothetical protein
MGWRESYERAYMGFDEEPPSYAEAAAFIDRMAALKADEERKTLLKRGMTYSFTEQAVAETLGWTAANCENHRDYKGDASCLRCGCQVWTRANHPR